MRDVLVLAILIVGIPVSMIRPFIGILLWCWVSYMSPHRLTWGIAYFFPAAQAIGAGTLIGFIFTKDRVPLPMHRETVLLLFLWGLFGVNTLMAFDSPGAWGQFVQVSKILLMTMVTMMLINTRQKLRLLFFAIALSIGFFGFKGGIFSIRTHGAERVYGPPGSFLEDNNDLALGMVMVLPMFFYLATEVTSRWFRGFLRVTGVLSAITVVFTYSRGGFLGLSAIAAAGLAKSKRKTLAVVLISLGLILGTALIPDRWFNRMQTIGDVGEESAAGRINAWHFAWNLAVARLPIGGGFETYTPDLFLKYAPNPLDFHAAHSIYFEMLADQGFLGLALFLILLFSTLFSLQKLSRRHRAHPSSRWIAQYADMLAIGIGGYMVSGAFLGRAYFDLSYHLIACAIILKSFEKYGVEVPVARAVQWDEADEAAPSDEAAVSDEAGVSEDDAAKPGRGG